MMRPIRLMALAAVLVGVGMPVARAAMPEDQAVLEVRAKQFARAVSTGRPEEMERLVKEHFSPEMQKIPMPAHIGIQMTYWDQTRGFDVVRLEHSSLPAYQSFVVIRNHLTRHENLILMRVEPEAPHRITTVLPVGLIKEGQPIQMPHPPAPARPRSNSQIARELDGYMKRLVQADVFSGVVLLAKDGEVVFQRAYGQADKEAGIANGIDTRFALASMHKMVTGVAIAQLVAKGKLSYEDPLSKFFPGAPEGSPFTRIRIKHLVSHTSGLSFWFSKDNPFDFSGGPPQTADGILQAASGEKLLFEPGTRLQYSNLGFHVLGPVIEKASGMSYADYVHEYIYKPAGMENGDPPKDPGGAAFAFSYQKQFDEHGQPRFHRSAYAVPYAGPGNAAGGGYATAADLLRFDQALHSGKLLSRADVQSVLSPKPELGANDYGYGFDVDPGRGSAGHSGGAEGVSNNFEMFLRSGWTVVVMSNYAENGFDACEPVVREIRQLLAARPSPAK